MKVSPRTAREIAFDAFLRGWIDIATIWEIAQRETDQPHLSNEELFAKYLSPERLSTLEKSTVEGITDRDTDTIGLHTSGTSRLELVDASKPAVQLRPSGPIDASLLQEAQRLRRSTTNIRENRYVLGQQLGGGGAGRVMAAFDWVIGRAVALKVVNKGREAADDFVHRFLKEAQITGQLVHPSIIPIYDLGSLADGQPCYTMPIVKHHSLADVLYGENTKHAWPLSRVCTVFVQVCRAMAYAHWKGVVHRDLKPQNILLGDYGEVYVSDWGVARVMGEDWESVTTEAPQAAKVALRDTLQRDTKQGTIIGTPGYMAPEQIRAEWSTLDHRADLFALGVILYEILTGQHPFQAKSIVESFANTVEKNPVPPTQISISCPLVLEDLCLKLLEKDKNNRPASAAVVAAEIEAFLEGDKELKRRRQEIAKLVDQAKIPARFYKALRAERDRLLDEARSILSDLNPWDSVTLKRAAWQRQEKALTHETEQARALAQAVDLYSRALGQDPDYAPARLGLADLFWACAQQAEADRNDTNRSYYESLVRDYDDGRYATILSSDARIDIRSIASGAEVLLYQYKEKDRVLVPSKEQHLGTTPIIEMSLAPGSYLLILRHERFRDVRYPLLCRRREYLNLKISLFKDNEIGDGFVYIPAGFSLFGGDPDAQVDPLPSEEIRLEDFAIAKHPVTFGEYLEFVNDLHQEDAKQAQMRLPRHASNNNPFVILNDQGVWVPSYEGIIATPGRMFCSEIDVAKVPVFSISWFDAIAFASWRSRRDGIQYRLPTEAEYEKSSRGADGRFFPWGNHSDPTFCKMRKSRPGYCQPEPVGTFITDQSPYGICDLAGGIREWAADIHNEISAETAQAADDTSPNQHADLRASRGGAWANTMPLVRASSRILHFASSRSSTVGMRLAKDIRK